MSHTVAWVHDLLTSFEERPFFLGEGIAWTYRDLSQAIARWQQEIRARQLAPHAVVALVADYSPNTISLFLALQLEGHIVVPLDRAAPERREQFLETAEVSAGFQIDSDESWSFQAYDRPTTHPLLSGLQAQGEAGIVLFSSGTTGVAKGTVLQTSRLWEKYKDSPRKALRTLIFLKLDHIGGINTLFAIAFNGGTFVTAADRSARTVCTTIERHQVELLPTTPTFLNMLLLSGATTDYNLSSLKVITYGTEVMPLSTLHGCERAFPGVTLKQTYGLTEMGIVSTRSRDNHSTWMKIGGDGVEVKVVDGILWLRTQTAMLGYLNAPNPFDEEGWYNTHDRVEVDGEYFRVLGRVQEIINVGGEKVFPAEVESVILELPGILEAVVRGRPSPVTGQVVTAEVQLSEPRDLREVRKEIFEHCRARLARYKIPTVIQVTERSLVSDRFKKKRLDTTSSQTQESS